MRELILTVIKDNKESPEKAASLICSLIRTMFIGTVSSEVSPQVKKGVLELIQSNSGESIRRITSLSHLSFYETMAAIQELQDTDEIVIKDNCLFIIENL